MNKERLLNVAKALRESPQPDKFDMDTYVHPCGTPACAFGHYAVRSDLQDLFTAHATPLMWQGIDHIGGKENISYDAAVVLEHFDITQEEADRIFGCSGVADEMVEDFGPSELLALAAKTPLEAAAWIERFVASH